MFEIAKYIRNITTNIFIKFIILILKTNIKIATTIKKKTKTIFKIYLFFLFIVSINNIENFFYLFLINKNKIILQYKITKVIYKITSNKILNINNIINKILK